MWKFAAGFLVVLVTAQAAPAKDSFLGALQRTAQGIERELCQRFPSRKCKTYQTPKSVKRQQLPVVKPQRNQQPATYVDALPDEKQAAIRPQVPPTRVQPPPAADGAACLQNLASAGVSFAPTRISANDERCIVATPVRVNSIGFAGGLVSLPDQPVLSCAFALQLAMWAADTGTKTAKATTGAGLSAIWTGPGFDCRGRNRDASEKLSEHAFGNAVDIERIKLTDGTVLATRDALKPESAAYDTLTDLRKSACLSFATVLGPGSDSAHEGHFHFDLAKRKSGLRICQ
jgi:hypothetical protein